MDELNEQIEQENEQAEQTNEGKDTFTKDEVLKLIQSESDKRVTQALKKQERELSKKYERQQSLASMNELDRTKAEYEDRITDLEAQLREFNVAKERAEMYKVMESRGMPTALADMISFGDDNVENLDKIDNLQYVLKGWLEKEINSRINGQSPTGTAVKGNGYMTKEEFQKLPLSEQMKMYERNQAKVERMLK